MREKSKLLATLLMVAALFAIEAICVKPGEAQINPPSRVFVFARSSKGTVRYTMFDGANWGEWSSIGGSVLGSPDACSPNAGEVIVFVRSQSSKYYNELFFKNLKFGQNPPKSWVGFRVKVTSDPGAVCRSGGKVDVFVRGSAAPGAWHAWAENGIWANPFRIDPKPGSDEFRTDEPGIGGVGIGGDIKGGPDACSWGGQRLDVFARGLDDYIWHTYRDEQGKWYGWESVGGLKMASDPSAVARANGQISIFASDANSHVWTKAYSLGNDRWGPWLPLPVKAIVGGPDATRTADNRIDVFARGVDDAIWHTSVTYKGNIPDLKNAPAWESLGGECSSDPSAVGVNW